MNQPVAPVDRLVKIDKLNAIFTISGLSFLSYVSRFYSCVGTVFHSHLPVNQSTYVGR